MERKIVSGIMLTLLLIGVLMLAFNIQPVEQAFASSVKGTSLLLNGGFELWSGTPPLPDGWFIVSIGPTYNPKAIHKSTVAHSGNFSLRLGGENTSEVGYDLAVVIAQDVPVCVGMTYRLSYYAFGHNPWGNLAGGIRVDWLNASKNVIAQAIPRVSLPAGGVLSYTSFSGTSGEAPSDAVYARIYVEKTSWGFINFDDVTFQKSGAYPWAMFHLDNRRRGWTYGPGRDNNLTQWVKQLNESIVRSSPAVINGRVFIGGYRESLGAFMPSSVWCLNETTGDIIWRYETGSCITSSPTVVDGKVFIGSLDNKLYCLDETTGTHKWDFTTLGGIYSSPAVDHMTGVPNPDRVIFGSMDGKIYCLNENNGALIWQNQTNDAVESSPAIFENKVFIGSNDNNTYCLNEGTGAIVWRYATNGSVRSTPSIGRWGMTGAAKTLGVGSDDGHLYAIDADTGALVWVSPYLGGAVISSPAVRTTSCNFYVGSMNGSVYAVAVPGVVLWNRPIGGTVASSPALDSIGNLYVGHAWRKTPPGVDYGALMCLSIHGSVKWTYDTGTPVTSSPAVADGRVFVGAKDGKVYCFGTPPNDVDAIAVWQHAGVPDHVLEFDIWYSVWDETKGKWWTPTGAEAAPLAVLPHGNDYDPNIAFDRNDNSICVWAHENETTGDYDVWFSRWVDPITYVWTPPAPVAEIRGNDLDPAIAFDTNGYAIAVWVHEFSNLTRVIFYSLWNGATWIGPAGPLVPLPDNWLGHAALPEITFTAANASSPKNLTAHQAVAIWADSDFTMYYSSWNGSAWTAPSTFAANAPPCDVPIPATHRVGISSDTRGNATAVWGTNLIAQQVYYAVWNGLTRTWTPQSALDNAYGYKPAIAFNTTSNAIAAYTSNATATVNIWCSQHYGGGWQPATQAADSRGNDQRPAITFLRDNKAIAVWWSDKPTPSEIYYSRWNGSGWHSATMIVSTGLNGTDINPAIASNSGSPSTPPSVFHDIAVTGVKPNKPVVGRGFSPKVYVNVTNQGGVTETFDLTAYANMTGIQTQTLTLASGASTNITFTWNTTGVPYGKYTISAYATPVPGETDVGDNTYTGGWVEVRLRGDVNGDGKVSLADVGKLKLIYSQVYPYKCPPFDVNHPEIYYYLPSVVTGKPEYLMPDINCDGKVTFADVGKEKLIYSGIP